MLVTAVKLSCCERKRGVENTKFRVQISTPGVRRTRAHRTRTDADTRTRSVSHAHSTANVMSHDTTDVYSPTPQPADSPHTAHSHPLLACTMPCTHHLPTATKAPEGGTRPPRRVRPPTLPSSPARLKVAQYGEPPLHIPPVSLRGGRLTHGGATNAAAAALPRHRLVISDMRRAHRLPAGALV